MRAESLRSAEGGRHPEGASNLWYLFAALRPPGIVAFSKDWHEDPTSNHHVLRELARERRVLWLNSIGTRTPKLSSSRDLGKIQRKLKEFTRGPVNVEND